jgi:hypothetical protein
VKTLHAEKVSLSSLLEAEKTKFLDIAKEEDDLSKKNAELKVQLNDLRHWPLALKMRRKRLRACRNCMMLKYPSSPNFVGHMTT